MCLRRSRSASRMKGILSLSLSSFQRLPSRLEISALCMSGDCSMILRRSICDHTMKAFMGRLMCPLGVLHQLGSSALPPVEAVEPGVGDEAMASSRPAPESELSPASSASVFSALLVCCTMAPAPRAPTRAHTLAAARGAIAGRCRLPGAEHTPSRGSRAAAERAPPLRAGAEVGEERKVRKKMRGRRTPPVAQEL